MRYGICPLSVVAVRSMPSHRSELVSQLLFGELVEVLDRKGKSWIQVRCASDDCVGWMETAQCKELTPSEFEQYLQNFAFSLELVQPVMGPDHFVPVTIGARLPNFDGLHFRLGDTVYTFSGQALTPGDIRPGADFILKLAKRYLNSPFLSGGRSPFGVDSSGLVQLVYQFAGYRLPREPVSQLEYGETVDFVDYALPGDLAFFENRAGRIVHVGIVMPEGRIIHAHGAVRIDRLDHYGIFDESRQIYTRQLRLIKRILPPPENRSGRAVNPPESLSRQVELF